MVQLQTSPDSLVRVSAVSHPSTEFGAFPCHLRQFVFLSARPLSIWLAALLPFFAYSFVEFLVDSQD
jgi:hypothetical protein